MPDIAAASWLWCASSKHNITTLNGKPTVQCLQDMGSIDKDIEAESLKALAAQSRLNSTLTSVYARSAAQQEDTAGGADVLDAPAIAEATAKLAQTVMPASTATAKGAPSIEAASAAKVASLPAPGVQQAAGLMRPGHERQAASRKEAPKAEARGSGMQGTVISAELTCIGSRSQLKDCRRACLRWEGQAVSCEH